VGDQDFDFGLPAERREAREFEPPPWERDQFERLAKERAESKAAEETARAAVAEVAAAQTAAVTGEAPVASPVDPAATFTNGTEEQTAVLPARPEGEAADGGATPVDDRQIAAMMMDLKAEEPAALGSTWIVAMMSAIVVGAVGLVLIVWGLTEAARSSAAPTGAMGAGILTLFGLGFGGMGAWLAFRTLRQRGVL
jgi:hypothetical protein